MPHEWRLDFQEHVSLARGLLSRYQKYRFLWISVVDTKLSCVERFTLWPLRMFFSIICRHVYVEFYLQCRSYSPSMLLETGEATIQNVQSGHHAENLAGWKDQLTSCASFITQQPSLNLTTLDHSFSSFYTLQPTQMLHAMFGRMAR